MSSKSLAELDGIYYELNDSWRSRYIFHVPCESCGRILKKTQYSHTRQYLCDYCKGKVKQKEKAIDLEIMNEITTPAERQFEKALDRIERTVGSLDGYEKAIKAARNVCEKFGSIPETMVAIELLKLGYRIIPQQKVGKYRVDFAIPKEKLVIEVDGKLYHTKKFGGNREAAIQVSLGMDWKIIHIPAEEISRHIDKLQECINKLANL